MFFLAFAIEINLQFITTLVGVGICIGAICYGARKRFASQKESDKQALSAAGEAQIKAQAEVAKIYEDLYRAEKEAHDHTKGRLTAIEQRLKAFDEQHDAVLDLNLKHQETIRLQASIIHDLRQRLQENKIDASDIK